MKRDHVSYFSIPVSNERPVRRGLLQPLSQDDRGALNRACRRFHARDSFNRTLTDVPKSRLVGTDSLGFIGETDVYRVHLHYQQDKDWLRSNDAALMEQMVNAMVKANKAKSKIPTGSGKKLLVFAAAKFMSQRELSKAGVDFCQLPYAIHRMLGD